MNRYNGARQILASIFALFTLSVALSTRKEHTFRSLGEIPVVDGIVGGGTAKNTALAQSVSHIIQAEAQELDANASTVRFVENSGVCETTPGVYQASGYIDVAADQHMWASSFWYFEARSSPDTAPLTLWLNGGPGSSSMIGLFQENGPCRINNDSSDLDPNPYSWNEVSNMIFIDQPIGAGYSYGATRVSTTDQAVTVVYKALQMWLAHPRFASLQGRAFHIATESYGGHYGPALGAYILDQNAKAGSTGSYIMPLGSLTVGNGLTAPQAQYPSYMLYAEQNPYNSPLVDAATIERANASFYQSGGCRDQIAACQANKVAADCSAAQTYCNNNVMGPLSGDNDVYDVRSKNPDPYPPALEPVIDTDAFRTTIGAESRWNMASYPVYLNFLMSGDWMLDFSSQLVKVIDSGARVAIWDGEADYIVASAASRNFIGVEAQVDQLKFSEAPTYANQKFANWVVDGQDAGVYKNAGNFSYTRVYGAGHEIPAYGWGSLAPGQAALAHFKQVIAGRPVSNS